MKITKTFSFDNDVLIWLKEKGRMSEFLNALCLREMQNERLSTNPEDLAKAVSDLEMQREGEELRAQEHKMRIDAWKSVPLDLQEVIRRKDNWGTLWRDKLYPILRGTGALTLDDVVRA